MHGQKSSFEFQSIEVFLVGNIHEDEVEKVSIETTSPDCVKGITNNLVQVHTLKYLPEPWFLLVMTNSSDFYQYT